MRRAHPQVLGVTNYSHWGDAGAFRACLQHPGQDGARLRGSMLRVATQRIGRFSHVGTTDRLFDSAASALVSPRDRTHCHPLPCIAM